MILNPVEYLGQNTGSRVLTAYFPTLVESYISKPHESQCPSSSYESHDRAVTGRGDRPCCKLTVPDLHITVLSMSEMDRGVHPVCNVDTSCLIGSAYSDKLQLYFFFLSNEYSRKQCYN